MERLTGLDFLTALSDGVEEEIERQRVSDLWPSEEGGFVRECGGRGE